MDIEQRLKEVADQYRAKGYKVVVRPGPDELPDFAKDFKVEAVARRGDGSALVSAKKTYSDLQSDPELARYAEITEKQPGWRLDVLVLEPDSRAIPDKREAQEPSEEEIRRSLEKVEQMLQAGFIQQALIAGWAAFEAAMRKRLQAEGEKAGWGSSPRTLLNELYSGGVLQPGVFRDLESLFHARSAIVHGFTTPQIENTSVQFLVETARRLLEESRTRRKTA